MKVDLSCPLELSAYTLPEEARRACTFTFFNLTDRALSSMQITVTCFDQRGQIVSRRVERPMSLNAQPRHAFSVEWPLDETSIEAVDLVIDKAWFEDGTDWRRAQQARLVEYTPNELPENRQLEQLRFIAGNDAVGYPSLQTQVWVCVCGRVNGLDEANCRRCNRDHHEVFAKFNEEMVTFAIDTHENLLQDKARLAREEASKQAFLRQQRERTKKRGRRVRTIFISVALVLAAAVYLFIVLGLPEMRYQTGITQYEQGNYPEASVIFAELLDYRDAPLRIKDCQVQQASLAAESGDIAQIDTAMDAMKTLGAFPGASEQLLELTYQKGLLLINDGSYEAGLLLLADVKGYKDTDDRVNTARYDRALAAMNAGDYATAAQGFTAMGTYKDAAAQAKECIYRPADALMNEGKFDEAAEQFALIAGYRDSNAQRLSCIYQAALAAQLAGNYEFAAERFQLLGSYEDSSDQVRRSIYLAANAARDAGSYATALGMYATIPDYEDAAIQIKACSYLPARQLMTDGDYTGAAALLRDVPGYLDADALLLECQYRPAVALLTAGEYDMAIAAFKPIADYQDVPQLLGQAEYARADELYAANAYEAAALAFEGLGFYQDAETRAQAARYAWAEQAFQAGTYAIASERFEGLGAYKDAATRMKECAYQQALLVLTTDDLQAAYEALAAIKDYPPAAEKAKDTIYTLAELYEQAGDMPNAADAFDKAGAYLDSVQRANECRYAEAARVMADSDYEQAATLFDAINTYADAKTQRDLCYDLWLKARADKAAAQFDVADYLGVLDTLRGLDIEALPATYADTVIQYKESNLRLARQMIEEDRSLEAYQHLMAIGNYKNAKTLLDRNIYKILGTWETENGVRYAFYLNGTCAIDGQTGYFNLRNTYGIFTGSSQENLVRTHSLSSSNERNLALRDDATGKILRLTRVKQAEVSPTADKPAEDLLSTIDPEAELTTDVLEEE